MKDYFDPLKNVSKTSHKLPHWQQDQKWIFVTYRLADSLPKSKINALKEERDIWTSLHPKPWTENLEAEYLRRFSSKIDEWLDQGHGSCLLAQPELSAIVAKAFFHFDESRYQLESFVVMPNHVHVLFTPGTRYSLSDLIQTWKRFTAREINKKLNTTSTLWQPEYWDRLIRSEEHFSWVKDYIRRNPVNLQPNQHHLYERTKNSQ